MIGCEARSFFRLRLFHFHDQLAGSKDRIGIRQDFCADQGVRIVREARTQPGARLNVDLMARAREFADTFRCQPDTRFLLFDFCWNTNAHLRSPRARSCL